MTEGETHKSAARMKTVIRRVVIGGALLSAFTLCFGEVSPFSSSSVCQQCGMLKYSKRYHAPFSDWVVKETERTESTPVSEVMRRRSIVPAHEHEWRFGSGGGHGVTCAIGPGRHLRASVTSKEVADLVVFLRRHGATNEFAEFTHALFDSDRSRAVWSHAISMDLRDSDDVGVVLADHREAWGRLREYWEDREKRGE